MHTRHCSVTHYQLRKTSCSNMQHHVYSRTDSCTHMLSSAYKLVTLVLAAGAVNVLRHQLQLQHAVVSNCSMLKVARWPLVTLIAVSAAIAVL
jgi:hypothetical protein